MESRDKGLGMPLSRCDVSLGLGTFVNMGCNYKAMIQIELVSVLDP